MAEGIEISTGMGAGEAQVFKPFDAGFQNLARAATRAKPGKMPDVDLGKIDVMPRDQEMFRVMGEKIFAFAEANADKLQAGDATALMTLQRMKSDYFLNANLSKNAREDVERVGNVTLQKPEEWKPESLEYLTSFIEDKENIGNYQFDKTKMKKIPEATPWLENFITKNKPVLHTDVQEKGEITIATKQKIAGQHRNSASQWVEASEDSKAILDYFDGDKQKAIDYLTENLNNRSATEYKRTIDEPREGFGFGDKDLTVVSNETFWIGQDVEGTKDEAGQVKTELSSYKSYYIKGNPSTTLSLYKDVIDLRSVQGVKERGERRLSVGSMKVIPVIIRPGGEKVFPKDEAEIERVMKNAPRTGEKVIYEPYVFGASTGLDEVDEKESFDVAVPASKIKGAIAGMKLPYDQAVQDAKQATAELNKRYGVTQTPQAPKGKTTGVKTPITNPTKAQYDALKVGDKYIYNDIEYTKE